MSGRRFALTHLAPAALLLALVVVPLALGQRTLFLRDTLLTHLSMREGLAPALRAGELPLVDPLRGGGQALAGNLNAVPLYPDNLLLLFTSTLWQLNAHFWLHWIVAFAAAYWLARALAWGAPAAAMTGAAYAFSGFMVSQMNLYNGVAPAALAPALAAAAVELLSGERPRRGFVALALLWALALLGGDPIVAGLALVAGLAIALGRARPDESETGRAATRRSKPAGNRWLLAAFAIALGTALAAPQILATRAILPESSRGFRGFEARDMLLASPEPPALLELFLPLFFGRPDSGTFWGNAYFGDTPPLYFSLAPGAIALAFAWVALRRGGSERVAPALVAGAGALLTFAAGTPISSLLAAIPGMSLVRFQAKFAVCFALGAALLAGLGAERFSTANEPRGATTLRRALAVMTTLHGLFVLFCAARPSGLFDAFARRFGDGLTGVALDAELKRWAGIALLTLIALVVVRLAMIRPIARFAVALPVAIALQAGLQLLLLRGILPTDEAAFYRRPPAALAAIPESSRLVHGAVNQLFGAGLMEAAGSDTRLAAQVRRAWESGFDVAAHAAGRATELDSSPEGLDHFTLVATEDAIEALPDAGRVRLLRATGVDLLLLPRALQGVSESEARLVRRESALAPPLSVYEISGGWGDAAVAPCVSFAPHMNAALARLLADDFDPRREAVLPGSGAPRCAGDGQPATVAIEREARELVELAVDVPAGGVLVLRRAFLPIWRAEIDGRPAKPAPGQMTRLAVELPAGAKRVRLFVDRSPVRLGIGVAAAAALALALLAFRLPNATRMPTP